MLIHWGIGKGFLLDAQHLHANNYQNIKKIHLMKMYLLDIKVSLPWGKKWKVLNHKKICRYKWNRLQISYNPGLQTICSEILFLSDF